MKEKTGMDAGIDAAMREGRAKFQGPRSNDPGTFVAGCDLSARWR